VREDVTVLVESKLCRWSPLPVSLIRYKGGGTHTTELNRCLFRLNLPLIGASHSNFLQFQIHHSPLHWVKVSGHQGQRVSTTTPTLGGRNTARALEHTHPPPVCILINPVWERDEEVIVPTVISSDSSPVLVE
jgi:hypothetical protein